MSLKYKASLSYFSDVASRHGIPVKIFRVHGGTLRDIDLKSTDDISISSEMEQARFQGNLSLGISRLEEAGMELINLAVFDKRLKVQFVVERYSGKKMLEGLALFKKDAFFQNVPYVENNLLFIDLIISDVKLFRGKLLRQVEYNGEIYKNYYEGSEV